MPLTVVTPHGPGPSFEKTLLSLRKSALAEYVMIASQELVHFKLTLYPSQKFDQPQSRFCFPTYQQNSLLASQAT